MIISCFMNISSIAVHAQDNFVIEDGVLISYQGDASELALPEGITTIQEKAFYGNSTITSITMNDEVRVIEKEAFAYCENLQNIHLSAQLESLGAEAFMHTKQLTHIYLPPSLKIIDYCDFGIFYGSGLECVYIGDGMEELPYYLFKNAKQLKEVYLPQSLSKIQDGAFYQCSQLQIIGLPQNLTYLGDHVFYQCVQLSDVLLPSKLEYMGADVFEGCSALTKIHIPKSLKRIALTSDGIFSHTNLQDVSFEAGIRVIPQYLFKNATTLTKLQIPDTVEQIQDGVFYGCDGLSEVYLPSSVVHLRRHAFASCKNLKNVYGLDQLTYFDEKAFSDSNNICVYVSEGSLVYEAALRKGWDYVLMQSPNAVSSIAMIQQDDKVKLTWEHDGWNDGFMVSYDEEGQNEVINVFTSEPYVEIEGLHFDTNYVFEVVSLKQYPYVLKTSLLQQLSYTLLLQPVEIVQVEQASSTALKVTWQQSQYATSYELYRATSIDGKYYLMGTYAAPKTSAIIKGQQTGRTYYYKVKAIRGVQSSDFSSIQSGKSILYQNQLQYNNNKLTWNAVSGASYYQLYRAIGSGSKFQKLITLAQNKRSYVISNHETSPTYYKIRGYKKYGDNYVYSTFSNIVKVYNES